MIDTSPQIPQAGQRNILLVLGGLFVLIGALVSYMYVETRNAEVTFISEHESQTLALQKMTVLERLEEGVSDLRRLAEQVERATGPEDRILAADGDLAGQFLALCRFKIIYERIMLVDETGQEVARAEYRQGQAVLVSEAELDNRRERPCFNAAISLRRGWIYLAPEGVPAGNDSEGAGCSPSLHMAMPVFDVLGRKRGLLVLTYSAQPLIRELRIHAGLNPRNFMMLDGLGGWLIGPHRQDDWAFGSPRPGHRLFVDMFPGEWERIKSETSGQFMTENGLFTFDTIRLFSEYRVVSGSATPESASGPAGEISHDFWWKVVSRVEPPVLHLRSKKIRWELSGLAAIIFLILALGASRIGRLNRQRALDAQRLAVLRRAIEQSPATVVITDLKGNIEYVNPKFTETTGFSREEAQGQNPRILKSGQQPPEIYRQLWENISTGQEWRGELLNRRKSGETYWEFASISPIKNSAGEITHYLAIKEEISERKRAEVQLRLAMEAAEAASRAKTEFLANISHEIRTPMNGILGMTDLLLETSPTPVQREYLEVVQTSARALMVLIRNILDVSRMESGHLEVARSPLDLEKVIEATIRPAYEAATKKGLELTLDIADDVPRRLLGDPRRLAQILEHVVGNAVKFTPRGEVSVKVEKDRAEDSFVELRFTVSDTGIGIPPEKHRGIFSAFVQGDGSSTRSYGGAGLGLAIASQLVVLMGGRVWLESEPGQGSTFYFTVRLELSEGAGAGVEPGAMMLQGVPILVVDNWASRLRILSRWFKDRGAALSVAMSSGEALLLMDKARTAGRPFRLVLMNDQLGDMSGLELAARLAGAEYEETRVVIMAEEDLASDPEAVSAARLDGIVVKPVLPSDLQEAVQAALDLGDGGEPVTDRRDEAAPGPARILLADRHPLEQHLMGRMLEKLGHEVTAASDGMALMNALEAGPADLVMIDMDLPSAAGLRTVEVIRRKEKAEGGRMPIIGLMGRKSSVDAGRCRDSGVDVCVRKPVRRSDLRDTIRDLLRGDLQAVESRFVDGIREPAFDLDEVTERVEGDMALVRDLSRLLIRDLPRHRTRIGQAIQAGDHEALHREALSMKSNVANFAARPVMRLLDELAGARCGEDKDHAEQTCGLLDEELGRLVRELEEAVEVHSG